MDILELANRQQAKAWDVIHKSRVMEAWEDIGAAVNLVGSLKIGVLAKHRDIDFHIYTPELDVKQSFKAISTICSRPQVVKCEFANLSATEECCLEWHVWFLDDEDKETWQIDMIQIKRGSAFDGYFEKVAEDIKNAMKEEQRRTILKLKFETPDNVKISGIEYYKAVIQNGITTFDELQNWRSQQNFCGIIEW